MYRLQIPAFRGSIQRVYLADRSVALLTFGSFARSDRVAWLVGNMTVDELIPQMIKVLYMLFFASLSFSLVNRNHPPFLAWAFRDTRTGVKQHMALLDQALQPCFQLP